MGLLNALPCPVTCSISTCNSLGGSCHNKGCKSYRTKGANIRITAYLNKGGPRKVISKGEIRELEKQPPPQLKWKAGACRDLRSKSDHRRGPKWEPLRRGRRLLGGTIPRLSF